MQKYFNVFLKIKYGNDWYKVTEQVQSDTKEAAIARLMKRLTAYGHEFNIIYAEEICDNCEEF